MKEKLEYKINEIIDYIISKPVENITREDFAILAGKLQEIKLEENQESINRKYTGMLISAITDQNKMMSY